MARKRKTPGCPRCQAVRRANAALDERIIAVKTRLLIQLEALERDEARRPR